MSELYKRIEFLCEQSKINITVMCKASGASRASLTDLKMGRKQSLSSDTLTKIANFFSVSVDYLLTGEEPEQKENAPVLTAKDERDIAKKLDEMLGQLGSSEDALMFDGEPLDDETRELLRNSLKNQLEITKRLAKQKYTPKKYRK